MTTPESENMCQAFILRLLLDDSWQAVKPDEVGWKELLEVARRNVVLIRLSDKLHERGVNTPEFFNTAVEEQRRLNLENSISSSASIVHVKSIKSHFFSRIGCR